MNLLQLFLLPAVFVAIRILLSHQRERQFRKFAAEHGCKPAFREPSTLPWGISRFYSVTKILRNGGDFLEDFVMKHFFENGKASREDVGLLGTMTFSTMDPKNIQTVMSLKFNDFEVGERRHGAFGPLLGKSVFTTDGPGWEHYRALLRPQFARENLNNLDAAEYNFQALLKVIPTGEDDWTMEVDLDEHFHRLTMDGATAFFFRSNVNSQLAAADMAPVSPDAPATLASQKDGGATGFAESFNIAQEWMTYRLQFQDLYWLVDGREFRKACRNVHNYTDAAVRRVLSSGKTDPTKNGYSLLESLSRETQDAKELRDQCLTVLLGGRDTIASLLSWVITMFVIHPRVFQKLRTTILEEFNPKELKEISFTKLKNCKYLQYVISETLRLYCPIPLNGRVAIRDTVLPRGGGPDETEPVAIRKGQHVFISPYAMHRRADIWGPDVHEFKPERWEGRKSDWSYLPFSGGPRICLGRKNDPKSSSIRIC